MITFIFVSPKLVLPTKTIVLFIKFNNFSLSRLQKAHLIKEVILLLFRFKVLKFDNVLPLLGRTQCNGLNVIIISKE